MGDTRALRVCMDVDERDVARVVNGATAEVTAGEFHATRLLPAVVSCA